MNIHRSLPPNSTLNCFFCHQFVTPSIDWYCVFNTSGSPLENLFSTLPILWSNSMTDYFLFLWHTFKSKKRCYYTLKNDSPALCYALFRFTYFLWLDLIACLFALVPRRQFEYRTRERCTPRSLFKLLKKYIRNSKSNVRTWLVENVFVTEERYELYLACFWFATK